jgi:hypothetical protein
MIYNSDLLRIDSLSDDGVGNGCIINPTVNNIKIKMRRENMVGSSSTYAWFRDSTTEMGYIQFNSAGALWFVQSSNNRVLASSYTLEQWYEIELKNIDFSTHTFDVWLDGVEKFTDLTFTNNINQISNIRIATFYATTTSYVDYIYGYSQLENNYPEIYEMGIFTVN